MWLCILFDSLVNVGTYKISISSMGKTQMNLKARLHYINLSCQLQNIRPWKISSCKVIGNLVYGQYSVIPILQCHISRYEVYCISLVCVYSLLVNGIFIFVQVQTPATKSPKVVPKKKEESSEDSDSSSSEEQVAVVKKKQVETKKAQKSSAVTKAQNKTSKVTSKPVDEESSSEESSDEEPAKPAKPVSKPVVKVSSYIGEFWSVKYWLMSCHNRLQYKYFEQSTYCMFGGV